MKRHPRAGRRAFWWGVLLAAHVALVVSGLPVFAVELSTGEPVPCATDCEGSDGNKHCPPNCPYGACARTVQAVPAIPLVAVAPAASRELPIPVLESSHPREPVTDVFHPPRS